MIFTLLNCFYGRIVRGAPVVRKGGPAFKTDYFYRMWKKDGMMCWLYRCWQTDIILKKSNFLYSDCVKGINRSLKTSSYFY